jgi:hypothetical protein
LITIKKNYKSPVEYCRKLLNMMAKSTNSVFNFVKVIAASSLIVAPLLTLVGWGIAHDSLGSLLHLKFSYAATDATAGLTGASDPWLVFRYYLLPHYFIYASMPVYIGLALSLVYATYKNTPWHSFIGAILSIVGAVYFVGVLGAFLSVPMGSVTMTGLLKVSFVLCMLVFVGNIVLGLGLFQSQPQSKWFSLTFVLGNLLILVFASVENWMAFGSLLMIIGLFPLARKILIQHM